MHSKQTNQQQQSTFSENLALWSGTTTVVFDPERSPGLVVTRDEVIIILMMFAGARPRVALYTIGTRLNEDAESQAASEDHF